MPCGFQNRCGTCSRSQRKRFRSLVQLEVASNREFVGLCRQHLEVRRQAFGPGELSRNSDEEVFVLAVQAREGADGVARVGSHAKFADAPDIDGNPHEPSVNRNRTQSAASPPSLPSVSKAVKQRQMYGICLSASASFRLNPDAAAHAHGRSQVRLLHRGAAWWQQPE